MAKKRTTAKHVQAEDKRPFEVPQVDVKPEIDDSETDADGLTVKQRLFVEALTGPMCGNATKAAQAAGYCTENVRAAQATASRMLSNVMVQEAVSRALARKRLTADYTKERLVALSQSSLANFLTIDENGREKVDLLKGAAAGAIGQISELTYRSIRVGEDWQVVPMIKVHNPTGALGILAKMHGLIRDSNEPEVPVKQLKVRRIPARDTRSD